MFLDFLKLALRNIRHRKRRSWLTILGTLIGILAIVALLSIGQGLENSVQKEVEEIGGDKVFISPGGGRFQRFTGTSELLTQQNVRAVENTLGVDRTLSLVTGEVLAKYRGDSTYINLRTGPLETKRDIILEVEAIEVQEGRFLRAADTKSVVVPENAADGLFDEDLDVGSRIKIEGEKFRVVGIVSRGLSRSSGIYIDMETARSVLNKSEGYDALVAEVQSGENPRDVEESIRRSLRQSRDVEEGSEDFSTSTADDIIRSFNNQLAIIRGVLLGIGGISLLVGAVGIMNTMYTSVTQRTREIGVMKAVGATKKQIMLLFMIESGIIGAVGGILGVVFGIGISKLASQVISNSLGIQFSAGASPALVLGSVFFAFLLGMVSGVLPARKAARLEPAEALSY